MSEQATKNYWFPAKTYGWGWGLPLTWQGWMVFAAYMAWMVTAAIVFPPKIHIVAFLASVFGATSLLILICWKTGEPPKWRWGKDR